MTAWPSTITTAGTCAAKVRLLVLLAEERRDGHDLAMALGIAQAHVVDAVTAFVTALLREARTVRLPPLLAEQAQEVLLCAQVEVRRLDHGVASLDALGALAGALEELGEAIRTHDPAPSTHIATAIDAALRAVPRGRARSVASASPPQAHAPRAASGGSRS